MTLEIKIYLAAGAFILGAYLACAIIQRLALKEKFSWAGAISALLGTASAILFLAILLHGGIPVAFVYLILRALNLKWFTSKKFKNINR